MKKIGRLLQYLGVISYFIFGIWGLILSIAIVNYAAGFCGVVVGCVLFPVTIFAAPWYALGQWGTWYPLTVIYGGGNFFFNIIWDREINKRK